MEKEVKICANCTQHFKIEPEDLGFYEKINVAPPTWCPECRMIRRFMFRNPRHLFRRPDARSGEEIFSIIPKASPAKVYAHEFWNSDGWDPMVYGKKYDFSRPFLEQFRELLYAVPWPARSVVNSVNSDYSDNFTGGKNSYLCFSGNDTENSAYSINFNNIKECIDLQDARHAELSYDNYMADEAYRVFFSVNCEECAEIWFSRNLLGCSHCFGCVNLRNKSYYIFNKPYSKEAYREFIKKFASGSHAIVEEMRKKAHAFWLTFPMRFTLAINVTRATGEHIEHSKDIKAGYNIHESENVRYSQFLEIARDSYDYTLWGADASRMYECESCGSQCDSLTACWECFPSSRALEYSAFCRSSSDLFGCVGLKKKKYCILNMQYSKEEYHALREKIIVHMSEMPYMSNTRQTTGDKRIAYKYGEFFPPEFSPFAYNETLAQDYFPLTKVEAEKKGYLWREPEKREYRTTITSRELPDHIKDVTDDILKEIIACARCDQAYRIIPMELQFYRHLVLPLPRFCPECRFRERFKFVNPPKLWLSKCQCGGSASQNGIYENRVPHPHHGTTMCPNEFESSYAPGRPDIVYCESCYQQELA